MADPATLAAEDYLARLDGVAAAGGLGTAARVELRARTAEWIADRRAEAVGEGEDPMTAVLDTINALGTPEALLAEARANGVGTQARAAVRLTTAERIATIGLAVGWVTAGIGWIVGVVALTRAVRWTLPEKLTAAVLTLVLPTIAVQVGTSTVDAAAPTVAAFLSLIALNTLVPVGLVVRLRRRGGLPV